MTTDIRLLYIDGYCEPTEPRPLRKQTNPPSIPISQLYSEKNFPTGLCVPYAVSDVLLSWYLFLLVIIYWSLSLTSSQQNDQVAAQRFTSEEKRALERIQEDIYSDFRRAAEAHRYCCLNCESNMCMYVFYDTIMVQLYRESPSLILHHVHVHTCTCKWALASCD